MPIINPGTGGGSPGPQGPQGIQGFPGFGFDGIDGEDSLSIPGSQGATGSQGVPGINGSQGIPGEDGISGEDSFIPGPQGLAGTNGTNGAIGRDGARGLDGEDGLSSDDLWPGFNPFRDDPLEQISRIQDQNLRILPSYSAVVVGPYTINTGKTLTLESGGRFQIFQGANVAKTALFAKQVSSYTDSTTNTELMAGLGAANSTQIVTPITSGNLLVILSGTVKGILANSIVATVQLYYGTGTPPAAGTAPPTNSVKVGNPISFNNGGLSGNPAQGIVFPAFISRLQLQIAYWFDVSIVVPASITGVIENCNFVAVEL